MSMMDTVIPFALLCFTSLFTITSPLSTMPVFLTMTQSLDEKERRAVAIRATLVACCALLLFVLAGQFLFKFFGISTNVASQVHSDELAEGRNQGVCQRCIRGSFGNSFVMRAGGNSQCYRADAGSLFL